MPEQRVEPDIIHQGVSKWQNLETGEIIEAQEIVKKTSRQGFMITYLHQIIKLIDQLGNRKMQVVKYILDNMDTATNTLIITTVELAEKTGVSRQTVSDTLKILERNGIIARRSGAIMIHAQLLHRGSNSKEKYLLTKFQEWQKGDEGLDI